jgi:hypothetical protein
MQRGCVLYVRIRLSHFTDTMKTTVHAQRSSRLCMHGVCEKELALVVAERQQQHRGVLLVPRRAAWSIAHDNERRGGCIATNTSTWSGGGSSGSRALSADTCPTPERTTRAADARRRRRRGRAQQVADAVNVLEGGAGATVTAARRTARRRDGRRRRRRQPRPATRDGTATATVSTVSTVSSGACTDSPRTVLWRRRLARADHDAVAAVRYGERHRAAAAADGRAAVVEPSHVCNDGGGSSACTRTTPARTASRHGASDDVSGCGRGGSGSGSSGAGRSGTSAAVQLRQGSRAGHRPLLVSHRRHMVSGRGTVEVDGALELLRLRHPRQPLVVVVECHWQDQRRIPHAASVLVTNAGAANRPQRQPKVTAGTSITCCGASVDHSASFDHSVIADSGATVDRSAVTDRSANSGRTGGGVTGTSSGATIA